MMQELRWLESHVGTISDGVELVNKLCWNLTIKKENNAWFVRGGDQVLFCADNREAVDAFLYGMALAYSILPDEYVERFRKEFPD